MHRTHTSGTERAPGGARDIEHRGNRMELFDTTGQRPSTPGAGNGARHDAFAPLHQHRENPMTRRYRTTSEEVMTNKGQENDRAEEIRTEDAGRLPANTMGLLSSAESDRIELVVERIDGSWMVVVF
jgi:hypothetical protein